MNKYFLRQLPLENPFYLDARSVSLFRIGLGLVIVVELVYRMQFLEAFYTDEGVLSRELLLKNKWDFLFSWSLFYLNGSYAFALLLFLMTLFLSVLFIWNIRPVIVSILLWVLVVSVHNRNPQVLNAGDRILHILLFWYIFFPLSQISSAFDRKLPFRSFVSLPAAAFILQVFIIYFSAALFKDHVAWNMEGTAMYYALSHSIAARPWTVCLLEYPVLLKFVSLGVYYLELLAPWLLFMPVYNHFFRYLLILLFVLLHAGIWLLFELRTFPLVCIIMWLALLPSSFWRKEGERKILKTPFTDWRSIATMLLLIYVLLYSAYFLHIKKLQSFVHSYFILPAKVLQIQQRWAMFSPYPSKVHGSFSVEVEEGGKKVVPEGIYQQGLWKKYFINIYFYYLKDDARKKSLARYICSHSGLSDPANVAVIFYKRTTADPGEEETAAERIVLAEGSCR